MLILSLSLSFMFLPKISARWALVHGYHVHPIVSDTTPSHHTSPYVSGNEIRRSTAPMFTCRHLSLQILIGNVHKFESMMDLFEYDVFGWKRKKTKRIGCLFRSFSVNNFLRLFFVEKIGKVIIVKFDSNIIGK
jgi:hypothetical protein